MTAGDFKKIIVGYDATATGWDALRLGATFSELTGARLTIAASHPVAAAAVEEYLREARELLPAGLDADFRTVIADSPAAGLRAVAKAESADLIVVGWTHRSAFARATVGGTGEHLLHHAPCAVAVAPSGYAQQPGTAIDVVAAAYDGSVEAREALALAVSVALAADARLRLIGVLEPVPFVTGGFASGATYIELEGEALERLRANLNVIASGLPSALQAEVVISSGDPAEKIITRLGQADLLVVGSRGHGSLRRIISGSVSASLAHTAPCPLLIAPRDAIAGASQVEDSDTTAVSA